MRSTRPLNYLLSGSAVLALLAGCSGGGSSSSSTPVTPQALAPAAGRSFTSSFTRQASLGFSAAARTSAGLVAHPLPAFADEDAASKAAIIVSDAATNEVFAFTTAGKLTATISGFSEPQGITADKTGNIYIASTANSNIPVYKNDYKTLVTTLTDPNQYPVGVSVDSTGVVGVTNIISTAGGAGSVSFYAKGKTKPCVTVSNSTFARVYFDAFDAKGNLYVDGSDANGAFHAGVVTGGCKAKSITLLTVGNTINFPGGLQVSPTGEILIDDQSGSSGSVVYSYAPPVKGSLGMPKSTTQLSGSGDAVSISLSSTAKDVWDADASNAVASSFAYPKGGSAVQTIGSGTLAEPIGVVVTPLVK